MPPAPGLAAVHTCACSVRDSIPTTDSPPPPTLHGSVPRRHRQNDHAALLLSFDGRSGARSGTALRALQRDSAEEEGDEALGEETHLPGTPSPTSQGAPSCATDSAEGGGAAAAAKKTAAAAAAGGCGDAGESYAPLLGTPLRRPKSYSALSPPEGCTPTEHEDDHCCPTCLEEFTPENPQIVLQCAHAFHLACIYEWVRAPTHTRGQRQLSQPLPASF